MQRVRSGARLLTRRARPQVMMKLKNSRNLDARQTLLLDSAAYAARPPERAGARRKRRPPMHEYVRHLVHERLTHAELKQARPGRPAARRGRRPAACGRALAALCAFV
jgi:hypothetical protein